MIGRLVLATGLTLAALAIGAFAADLDIDYRAHAADEGGDISAKELRYARAAPLPGHGGAISRIKDIAQLQSARDNQLVGYGLVIGLQGSGDSLRNSPFTEQSIRAMLENLGIATEALA